MKETEILISLIFGICGFLIAFYMRRGLSFVLLCIFLYVSFKCLENLSYAPDWNNYHKSVSLLQQLGKTMLMMINNMISTAGTVSLLLFLFGGIIGIILSRRRA
ncbi:MAG: hypothetical protein AB1480_11705 [Nitrospirota bacterium]